LVAINYITGSCSIAQGVVKKDEVIVFENTSPDTEGVFLSIYRHFQLNYPKYYKMDNLSKLGWLASEILLKDSFKNGNYEAEDTGIILANTNSSLDNDLKYFDTTKDIPSPSLFVYTLPNIVIGEISIRNHFKGEHAFFIQETFDAVFFEWQVNYLLNKNILKACICGWVDVLEKEYKAVFFLVEKGKTASPVLFSAQNMDKIFRNS
jgi:hypothetical protein